MTSKTIVITGASDGIGAAAARRLSRNGDKVVVVGRSQSKTIAVAEELGADYFVADFADLSQVRALADKIRSGYPRIDVLANNAGGLVSKPETTADGLEKTYQVNYLAPFLLTTQLIDVLVDSRATVVNTTSSSHKLLRRVSVDVIGEHGPAQAQPSPMRSPRWQSFCSPGNYTVDMVPRDFRLRRFTPAMSTPTLGRRPGRASSSSCSGTRRRCSSPPRQMKEPNSWCGSRQARPVWSGRRASTTRSTGSRKPIVRPTIPALRASCGTHFGEDRLVSRGVR